MGHTSVLLAVLLVGLLSLNREAHSLFCNLHDPVGIAEISQSVCVNHTVTYEWMASDYVETEFEINCSNETHETGPIGSNERTYDNGGQVTTQVSPELEGNVQCVIRGCYEDVDNDFDIYSIAAVTVTCVSSDNSPTPTPSFTTQFPLRSIPVTFSFTTELPLQSSPVTPSFTTELPLSSSPVSGSSSISLTSNAIDVEFSPTPSPTIQSTQNSSPPDPILLYSVITVVTLVLLVIVILVVLIAIKVKQRNRGGRKLFLHKEYDCDNKVNMQKIEKLRISNLPCGSTSTIYEPLIDNNVVKPMEPNSPGIPQGIVPPQPSEQSHPHNDITLDGYVPDPSVGHGDSGPRDTLTSDPDINTFTANIPDGTEGITYRTTSPDSACVTGDSKDTTVICIPDIGTRESQGCHSQRESQLDMEPISTGLYTNDPTDQDIMDGFKEKVVGGTADSGHSINTSAGGYISQYSSNHCGTEG